MHTLDSLDKKILTVLDANARTPVTRIAKQVNAAKETVAYRLRNLEKTIIKGYYPIIDTGALGCRYYKIFLKLNPLPAQQRIALLTFIVAQPHVAQVLELEGPYDVQVFYLATSPTDLEGFLQALGRQHAQGIQRQEVLMVQTMYRFNHRLSDEAPYREEIVSAESARQPLDETSWVLLKSLCSNARTPLIELARRAGISAPAAYHKLKSLKMILGTHIAIDYEKLGLLHYHLAWNANNPSDNASIIHYCREMTRCIFATTMIGVYNASAEIMVASSAELHTVINGLLDRHANALRGFDALLIYQEHFINLYPL